MPFLNFRNIFYVLICFGFLSCSYKDEAEKKVRKTEYENDLNYGIKGRVVGLFYIPEMLALCVADSSSTENLGAKLEANYANLQTEAEKIGAEINGPLGQIKYNNDPKNFKFECLTLIKSMPNKQPTFGKVVVLEGTYAIVYNYYGPYETLYLGYKDLKDHLKENHLVTTGPMREFYVVTPAQVVDLRNCQTLIMVPVIEKVATK